MPADPVPRARIIDGERAGRDVPRRKPFRVDLREPALHVFDLVTRRGSACGRAPRTGRVAPDRAAAVAHDTGLYHMTPATEPSSARPLIPEPRTEGPDDGGPSVAPAPGSPPHRSDPGATP